MANITLIIANKTYSSWSLRAWLALKRTGAAFEEIVIPLDRPDTAEAINRHSPSGKVPALRHGDLVLWESSAIVEYCAESFPEAGLWPDDRKARAVARAVSAEMHAGFGNLRQHMPMNLRRRVPDRSRPPAVAADIARIQEIWRTIRGRFGVEGPFLFGSFSAADAMFAPVCTRFVTYGVPLDETAAAYVEAVMAWPDMQAWTAAALAEPWTIAKYEADTPNP